jgi:hypothetical protein
MSIFNLANYSLSGFLIKDGIYYAAESGEISYPEERGEASFEVEDQSFWFRHRNDCIRELVRNFPPEGKAPIFDVGAGNGFLTWNV